MAPPKEYPILWWTLVYDEDRYDNYLIDQCGLPYNCKMTLNHSYYDQSPLIIMQQWQIPRNEFIPRNTLPPKDHVLSGKKAWVLNSIEAPTWIARDKELTQLFAYRWTNWFNADFVEHYFQVAPGPNSFISRVLQPPMMALDMKNLLRRQGPANQQPLAPVAWVVSDCNSFNGRRFYVYQLLKYVDIDIYGKCMTNREWPKNAEGVEMSATEIVAQYKFYLALENSNCDDYVTEKLERAYATGVIPIVDGPLDYSRFDATGSALIKFNDFSSPKTLGRYIRQLDQDDEQYLQRLRYKVPKDPKHTPSTKDLARPFLRTWDHSGDLSVWGPDSRGAECGLCELTHDLVEGVVKLDGTKKIGIDKTCVFKKHYHVVWVLEYYWRITLSVALLIALVLYILSRRPVRHFLLGALYAIVPTGWIPRRYSRLAQSESLPMKSHASRP
ncbi:Alpha3-fucosyltransferase [Mortierella sp. NVP41]|nr:Alpha3-fucosyltransferase [Mortierella sp. NVP41]